MPAPTGTYSGRIFSTTMRLASFRSAARSAAIAGFSPSFTNLPRSSANLSASFFSSGVR